MTSIADVSHDFRDREQQDKFENHYTMVIGCIQLVDDNIQEAVEVLAKDNKCCEIICLGRWVGGGISRGTELR